MLTDIHATPMTIHHAPLPSDGLNSVLAILQQHVMVSIADADGVILFASPRLCELSQYAFDELVGAQHRIFQSGHHPADFYAELWQTIRQGQTWRGTFCDRRKDGGLFWLDTTIVPELDPQGGLLRYIAISNDVTEHMAAKQSLCSNHNRLQAMLASLPVLLFTLDAQHRFILVEGSALAALGIGADALLGRDIRAVFPGDAELCLALSTVAAGQPSRVELTWNDTIFATHLAPLRSDEHDEIGLIGVAIDITGKRQVEQQLRLNEERLRLSQEYADIGVWDCQVDSDQLRISEHLRESIGRTGASDCSLSSFLDAVHPEDRPKVAQALNASLRDGSSYDIEHRFLCDDGRVRWLNEKGKPVQSAAGAPVQLLGIIQDISTRKQGEHLLQILHRVTSRIAEGEGEACAWNDILDGLLDLTDSEFGLIACRNDTPGAEACLEVFTVGGRHWDAAHRHDYRLALERSTHACSADCALCTALTTEQPLLNNQLLGCTHLAGLVDGHPPLHSCLGVPLFYGSTLLGLYFLVNRPGGYHAKLVEFLAPFNSACASVIYAQKVSRERRQTLQELYAAKEEAEKANRAKSDFLSRMSHELRTPLNSVLGFAQLLQYEDDPALSSEQQEYVGQIVKSGNHLLQLINEVLDLAAIEVGKLQVSLENLALSGPLSDCLAITAPLAQRKGITLIDQTGSDDVPWVWGDALRLKQVLLNLLSNAIKYNRPQGEVRVYTSQPRLGRIRLHVADTGAGISLEQQAALFQPFNRLGLEYGPIEGSGIGLVITKSLVELMGGAMGVVSQPGQGSTFWFELDRVPAAAPETGALVDAAAFDRQAARFSLSGTLLYLEDSPDNQKLMLEICKGYGDIRLLCATNSEQALQLAKTHACDLILMDWQLPGESGFAAYQRLRQSPETRSIPVVVLSADAMSNTIETVLAAGVQAYLTKPLDLPTLIEAIGRYLQPITH